MDEWCGYEHRHEGIAGEDDRRGAGKLGGKSRVTCAMDHGEHVKLSSAVSSMRLRVRRVGLHGVKPKIAPAEVGYALEIGDAKEIEDLDLSVVAANATDKGQSSVTVFVHSASTVTFVRTELTSGTAKRALMARQGHWHNHAGLRWWSADRDGYRRVNYGRHDQDVHVFERGTSSGGAGGGPSVRARLGLPNLGRCAKRWC